MTCAVYSRGRQISSKRNIDGKALSGTSLTDTRENLDNFYANLRSTLNVTEEETEETKDCIRRSSNHSNFRTVWDE